LSFMDPGRRHVLKNRRGVPAFVALALLGCGSEKVAAPQGSVDTEFIVSAAIPRASLPGGADPSGSVVFVSAMPQSAPGAVEARVQGPNGQSVTTAVVDGGFDPVVIDATTGDVVTVTLTDGNGATVSQPLTVQRRRPPRVVRTSPAPNQTDVPLNAVIRVVFSAPVNLESARGGIRLTTGAGSVVPGEVEAAGGVAVEYVVTAGSLEPETAYRLDVTTDVRDLLGQALAEPVRVAFRTGIAGDDPRIDRRFLDVVFAPARIVLRPGESGQAEVKITRGPLFDGAVELSARSPAGVLVTFSTSRIEPGSTTATIQVEVEDGPWAGTKGVVIRAVGDGPRVATVTRTLSVVIPVVPPPPPGTLEVWIAPASVDVVPGGSTGQAEVTIKRGGSLTGAVSLGQTGPADGVDIGGRDIDAGSTTGTVNVSALATAVPGTRTVVIRAYGYTRGQPWISAPTEVAATTTLTVNIVAPAGSVSVAADPNPLAVAAGGPAVTTTIALTRTAPFAGPVDLTVTSVPNGITATLGQDIAARATSILSLSAAPGAKNGAYSLRVEGRGTDMSDAFTTVWFTITDGTPGFFTLDPGTVTVTAGGPSATSILSRNTETPIFGRLLLFLSKPATGLTASLSSRYMTSTTATLTVQAGAEVAAGTYFLTVTSGVLRRPDPDIGRGGSLALGSALLRVVVLAAP
jgi:hypothetical protein